MNSIPKLNGSHLHTYNAIFQHPISHNLNWHEVGALLKHLGQVEEESNGKIKVTRNGHVLLLHRPHTKEAATADEVMTLRHFLEKSADMPAASASQLAHWLLLIDHHEARLFRSEIQGGSSLHILPEKHFAHTRDSGNVSRGKEKPDPDTFFKPIAEALQEEGPILVFGTGTGSSSEMDQFVAWLKIHHPDQARRIVGSLPVDEHHLTRDQMLAKARDFYAHAAVPPVTNVNHEQGRREPAGKTD